MDEQVISRVGRYAVLAHIASGGMGTVYRALDTTLQRTVALKILAPDLATKPNMLERFRREARSAAQLHHENIVAVFEFGEVNGTYFLAMEYVTGIDLHEYIASRPKNQLDVDEARQILIQAAKALDCAHRQGIVHRDIKPSNFLICGKGESFLVKLTDFGLAREINSDEFRLTRDNTTLGTVDYISPEQAQDSGSADIRSDMYSLGCTFYHMLAGHAPFPTGSLPERILAHFQKEPADLRHINPAVPDRLWDIIRKLLAKKADDRYQTPLELLRALETPDNFVAYMKQNPGMEQALSDGPTNRMRAYDPTVILERSQHETPTESDASLLPDEIGLVRSEGDIGLAETPPVAEAAKAPPVAKAPPPAPRPVEAKAPAAKPAAKAPATPAPANKPAPAIRASVSPGILKKEAPPITPEEIRVSPRDKAPAKRGADYRVHLSPEERKHRKKVRRRWKVALLAGGGVFVVGIAFVIWLVTRPAVVPKPPIVELPPDPPPVVVKDKDKDRDPNRVPPPPPPPPPPATASLVGPERPKFESTMAKSVLAFDRAKTRREYMGPFADNLLVPENAKKILVSRVPLPGKNSQPTLEDAWKAAIGSSEAVIEIADQGPHFVKTLPRLEKCRLLVRAAPGFRPLILWDTLANLSPPHLAEFAQGELQLENLDIGVRWRNPKSTDPSAVFQMRDSSLQMWQCNLHQVGTHPRGLAVALLEGSDGMNAARAQFERCCLRGDDLEAVRVKNSAADVLFEGCLVASGSRPLLQWLGRETGNSTMRFLRSTLVTRNHLVTWDADGGRNGMFPNLMGYAWDSILAHASGTAGDLIHFDDEVSAAQVSWNVLNSAYLGWTRFLKAKDRELTTLEQWRGLRVHKEGDIVSSESFAPTSPSTLETPENCYQSFLAYKASAADGPIGVDFRALPPEPYPWALRRIDWAKHTFDGVELPEIAFPDAGKPDIPAAVPDVYSGEVIDVSQLNLAAFDLGTYLQGQMRGKKLAERIVIHVKGAGVVRTSPMRFQGMHVVLYFDNLKIPNTSLDLLGLQLGTPEPLVLVEQGTLEIINGRIRLGAAALSSSSMPYLIRAVGSNLHLSNCRVDGPPAPGDTFRALIQFQGQGPPSFHQLTLKECLFLSGSTLVELKGQGVGLRAKHNLLVTAADVFALAPGAMVGPRPDVFLFLDSNTFAWKDSLLHLTGAAPEVPHFHHPILVQASNDYHLSPFGRVAPVLRGNAEFFQRDILQWQGKSNLFDQTSLQTLDGQPAIAWSQFWGNSATQNSKWIDPKRPSGIFNLEVPNFQLLALPKSITQVPPPGANFKRLGL